MRAALGIISLVFSWSCFVRSIGGLHCYFCTNVNGNNGPCIRNHMECAPAEQSCFTKMQWSDEPYNVSGYRTIYVSKACMTASDCQAAAHKYAANCTRELYSDWTCVTCCDQDFCNYNVPTREIAGTTEKIENNQVEPEIRVNLVV